MLNELLGPSVRLLVLDMFLENPERLVNLREVARMVDKNPGSVSRVMPRLLRDGLLRQVKVGKVMYAYSLNAESEVVQLLIEFRHKLQEVEKNLSSYNDTEHPER